MALGVNSGFGEKKGVNKIVIIIVIIAFVALILIAGCITLIGLLLIPDGSGKYTTTTTIVENPTIAISMIRVNPCIGMEINLWDIPHEYFSAPKKEEPFDSPLPDGAKKVGSIPDCSNIEVKVLDRKCSPIGIEYDYIQYNNQKGWVTRRLLTCPASKKDMGCDSAPDSICSYG